MSNADSTPQRLVERALARSTADGCVVIVNESSTANVRWANNTLTTNGVNADRTVTVISTIDGAKGTAASAVSRSGVDAATIDELVAASEHAARAAEAAEDARPLVTPEQAPAGGDWDAPAAATGIGVFGEFAPALGDAFGVARSADRLLFGYAEHQMVTTYLGSSSGLRLRHDQPSGKVELNAKSGDFKRSAWQGASTRDFRDVDVRAMSEGLATRLGWAEREIALPAGRYETLLPPTAVADLYIYTIWSAAARDAHEGRTVFSRPGGGTRVGERLSGDVSVTLSSDPSYHGIESEPFSVVPASSSRSSVFDNGLALAKTDWISDGTLRSLITTRHSAELTGLPVAPPISNLIMTAGEDAAGGSAKDVAALIANTERALLLTSLWYIREVDPQTLLLTGLTRDGVYLVEHGEVVGAVNNFRFNESPVDILRRVREVGAVHQTLPREWGDYFTRAAMPTLRVADFNMSTVSQAS
jgi:predicted Zn-dependent protease